METKIKTSPKDFFLHLLSIVALYASAISFLTLVFQYLNIWLPNLLEDSSYFIDGAYGKMRWSIAILFVLFPTYLFTMRYLKGEFKRHPEKKGARVRKWLIYFTLFITALIIIGNLVTLIFNFLDGDFTARFILKVIAVFFVAGSIFYYYFSEIKAEKTEKKNPYLKSFMIGIIVIVIAMVVLGAMRVGSPGEAQMRKLDERRVQDLQSIQSQMVNYWISNKDLPEDLSGVQNDVSGFMIPKDPETGNVYEYTKKSDNEFTLCAEFKTEQVSLKSVPKGGYEYPDETWIHGAGKVCFDRTINKELYKDAKVLLEVMR